MTSQLDIDRILDGFLADGTEELADHVLEAALNDIDGTNQRRAWWPPRRFAQMNNFAKPAMAATAVLVVGILAFKLLPSFGIGDTPTPTPIATPTPSASPVPEISVGPLSAGTYLMPNGDWTLPLTVTVPSGWALNADGFIHKGGPYEGATGVTGIALATWLITHVYGDSCQWQGTLLEVGSRELLATSLAEQKGHTSSSSVEVTLGGLRASRLELTVPGEFDRSVCQSSVLRLWPDPGPDENGGHRIYPGQTTTVYAIEDKGKVMALFTVTNENSAAGDVAELQDIVDSVQFVR